MTCSQRPQKGRSNYQIPNASGSLLTAPQHPVDRLQIKRRVLILCRYALEMDLEIEFAASSAARQLGYDSMKDKQIKIVKEFVKGI